MYAFGPRFGPMRLSHEDETRFACMHALLLPGVMPGQDTRGTIKGRVTDPSGAVVPGASVIVTNVAMGTKTTVTTNQDGYYQALFLNPGNVPDRSGGPQGFKKAVRDKVEVRVADRLEINIRSEIGASEQTVTVTAEAAAAEHRIGFAGHGSGRQARRGPAALLRQPFPADRPVRRRDFQRQRPPGPSVRADPHRQFLDGRNQRQPERHHDRRRARPPPPPMPIEVTASYVPPTDIVQEFKVQTSTFDAQFGQTQGGVTNISIKSGTNNFHGSVNYSLPAPQFLGQRFFPEQGRHAAPGLPVQPLGRLLQRPGAHPESLQRQEQDLLPVRLRGHSRFAPAA